MMVAESVRRYALQVDDDGNVVGEYGEDPGDAVDRLVRRYMVAHNGDYVTAFAAVRTDPQNAAVVRAYALS